MAWMVQGIPVVKGRRIDGRAGPDFVNENVLQRGTDGDALERVGAALGKNAWRWWGSGEDAVVQGRHRDGPGRTCRGAELSTSPEELGSYMYRGGGSGSPACKEGQGEVDKILGIKIEIREGAGVV